MTDEMMGFISVHMMIYNAHQYCFIDNMLWERKCESDEVLIVNKKIRVSLIILVNWELTVEK